MVVMVTMMMMMVVVIMVMVVVFQLYLIKVCDCHKGERCSKTSVEFIGHVYFFFEAMQALYIKRVVAYKNLRLIVLVFHF
jgi:hypothetical protein